MSTLFISHSSRDAAATAELQRRLGEQGHQSVFLDFDPDRGIPAGVSWERTLYTQLRSCRAVLALVSDHYLRSHWCFAEVALARMEGKDLFALRIDPWSEESKMPSILTEDQYIDLRRDPEEGYRRLWNGFEIKGIVPAAHREWAPGDPPYPGLRAFDEKDAPIFFGRDREIQEGVELLTRVRRQGHPRMVMVLGSSGSGKSSLARAGILPRLRRDQSQWRLVGPIRPGRAPVRELAAALAAALEQAGEPISWQAVYRALDPAAAAEGPPAGAPPSGSREPDGGLRAELQRLERELGDQPQVAEAVRRLLEFLASREVPPPADSAPQTTAAANPLAGFLHRLRLAGGSPEASLVLVVDQFEELLGHDGGGRDHPASRFLRLLRDAIEGDDHPALVLGTMRSDFLGALQSSVPLRGVGFKSLSVGPMAREGMREVIEQPALLGQLELEPGLTDLLLDDTETSDALPLLAFTLRAMWERYRDDRLLDIREYRDLGRLSGAIARVADETLEASLAGSAERPVRDAFLALARPTEEGTGWARRPAAWDELPAAARPVLERFIDMRLLVQRADGTVEVAHEALFRSWGKLRRWLAANAEALHLVREIRLDARKWRQAEGEEEREPYLWRGGRLARALELRDGGVLSLADAEREFVDASHRAERARIEAEAARQRRELRRARIFAAVVGCAFLIALGSLFYALEKKRRAQDQAMVAVASDWLGRDPTRSALLLLELDKPDRAPRALSLLGQALGARLAVSELRAHRDTLTTARFSQDGALLVTASGDGTARLWQADGSPHLGADGRPVVLRHPAGVLDASFDPAGSTIVTGSVDGSIRIWRVDGTPVSGRDGLPLVLVHDDAVNSVAFSPSGDRLLSASDDGRARVWSRAGDLEVEIPHPLNSRGRPLEVNFAGFDGAGERIVTGSEDGSARIFAASGGEPLTELGGHRGSVLAGSFNASGDRVATASRDGTVRLWLVVETPDGWSVSEQVELPHPDQVFDLAFRPGVEGDQLLTACNDGRVRLWRSDPSGDFQARVMSRSAIPMALGVTADGAGFLTAEVDGASRRWKIECCGEPILLPQKSARDAVFRGDELLVASTDGTIREQALTGELLREVVVPGHKEVPERAKRIVFSPSRDRLLTAGKDGVGRLWHPDGTPVTRIDGSGEPIPVVFTHAAVGADDGTAGLNDAAFSADGDRVIIASDDGSARIWPADGRGAPLILRPAGSDPPPVLAAAWSPRGDRVATGSADGAARVWNVDGSPVRVLARGSRGGAVVEPSLLLLHDDEVHAVAWSPSGDRVATASRDRTARVWELAKPSDPVLLRGHDRSVDSVAWSPRGDRVVTGSADNTARVWNADGRGEPLILGGHANPVSSVAFDHDGSRVVTTSRYVDARVWQVTFEALAGTVRLTTEICLDPVFREKSLGESPELARRRYRRCLECAPAFSKERATRDPADAWRSYRGCLLAGRRFGR